jgi:hypothetical protein
MTETGRTESRSQKQWVKGCVISRNRTASLVIDGFQPVRSRWTWQPHLPELWLRELEVRQFREMSGEQEKAEVS